MAPQGARVMANAADVQSLLGEMMSALKARGYSRSEISAMRVNPMSDRLALVSVQRIRYKSDGDELERLGETYAVREAGGDWKIAAAMVHDPDAMVALA